MPAPHRSPLTRHVPALDGLRGLAVAGVLLFHGGHLAGGYLGVDLFFTISGFLITALLLREVAATGRVDLRSFWARRARRLLPALFGLLVGVTFYALVWVPPSQRSAVRGDVLATLLYAANWRSIVADHGYWNQFALPSPLQHTWSLAIEEQFYLVWPLVVVGLLWGAGRRGRPLASRVALAAGAAATASYAWMAAVYHPGQVGDRAYLGTDTRVGAILVGACVAAVLSVPRPDAGRHATAGPGSRWARARTEVLALAGIAWLIWAWTSLDGQATLLYRGGFALSALAAVAIIAAAVHPRRGVVGRVCEAPPLRALGTISYGLYLWHWPIFLALRIEQRRLGLHGWELLAAQVMVSLAAAWLSYRLLERGIRARGLAAWGRRGAWLMPAGAAMSIVAVLVATTTHRDDPPEVAGAVVLQPLPVVEDTVAPRPVPAAPGPTPRPVGRDPRVLVVGDSVGVDFALGLADDPLLRLDVVSRATPACKINRHPREWRAGGVVVPTLESETCDDQWAMWQEAVGAFKPDAVLVVFGSGLHGEVSLDGEWFGVCTERFGRTWQAETQAAIDLLAAGGATVHVALPADTTAVFLPDGMLEGTECARAAYRAAVDTRPEVARLVRLDTWVCPQPGQCRFEVEGTSLRPDGTHFQGRGRALAAAWIATQLFAPPEAAL